MSKDITYSGPNKDYESYPDNPRPPFNSTTTYGLGYHNYDELVSNLEEMGSLTKYLYDLCVNEMEQFTLKIDTSNEQLVKSHQMNYPDDDTPGSISFQEYIYNYSVAKTTSSLYVNRFYENKVRGIYGTNALDVAHITRIFYSEVKRIQDFLANFIGEVDDQSEFRVLEALQNWVQNSKQLLKTVEQAYQAKGLGGIPRAELDQLDEARARKFQGLFQSKINVLNSNIHDGVTELYKDYDSQADFFYNKVLGPSLNFSLKVSNGIESGLDASQAPLLHQEAAMSKLQFTSQFESAVSDQVKRNNLLYDYTERLLANIIQRDTYQKYLRQLSDIGAVLPNPFFLQIRPEPDVISNSSALLGDVKKLSFDTNAASDHNSLTGRDSEDAHPQYLKRSGDLVTGNFEVFGGLRLNGNDLTNVFATDQDGNVIVRAEFFDWANVSPGNTGVVVNEYTPDDLFISNVRYLSNGSVEYTVGFEIENNNVQGYEFEIIEI